MFSWSPCRRARGLEFTSLRDEDHICSGCDEDGRAKLPHVRHDGHQPPVHVSLREGGCDGDGDHEGTRPEAVEEEKEEGVEGALGCGGLEDHEEEDGEGATEGGESVGHPIEVEGEET